MFADKPCGSKVSPQEMESFGVLNTKKQTCQLIDTPQERYQYVSLLHFWSTTDFPGFVSSLGLAEQKIIFEASVVMGLNISMFPASSHKYDEKE